MAGELLTHKQDITDVYDETIEVSVYMLSASDTVNLKMEAPPYSGTATRHLSPAAARELAKALSAYADYVESR